MNQQKRVARTTGYLTEALLDLAEGKSVQAVQVCELCRAAQVNRSTFYRYYQDMPTFIDSLIDGFVGAMNDHMGGNLFARIMRGDAGDTMVWGTEFMEGRRRFIRVFSGPNGVPVFRTRLVGVWESQFKEAMRDAAPGIDDHVNLDIAACYVASVMWGLLEYMVGDGSKYAPDYLSRQMSVLLYDCTIQQIARIAEA